MKKDKIKIDAENLRIHDDLNQQVIEKSLSELGAGRSIVMDADNVIIAGNGVYEQAEKLGIKPKIIESDGTELIVVKRTDLKNEDQKRKLLAIVDNKASDLSHFDFEAISSAYDQEILMDWGFQPEELNFRNVDEFTTDEGLIEGEMSSTDQLFIVIIPDGKDGAMNELQKICLKHSLNFRLK